ncbi:unnamed protein product (macronuclear) [Paramecium tetraurelia]|uniref:START domain-containing protein n=1 Tax=Paramecium tetraurelia TaxID=5888 RepID=A0CG09_PARTE|nr:uncharacterized protein GSPATT00038169001 [Paramecium tetraurelia]CAK69726.1 unnamed protein product [Paramecium tetraurelia]|eukprot:XP_001437123.1 hypothetical protein (macronuclear) [Paramecium tetraurelia strain d4-2]
MIQQEQFTAEQIQQYDQLADQAIQQFQQILPLTPENKWEPHSDKNGFKIHLRPDKETGLNFSRGEGFLPYTIQQIVDILNQVENAEKFDELCEQASLIAKIREDLLIFYQRLKDMFIVVSGRDFVILQKRLRDGNKLWVVGKSIELASKPPVKGKVRGELKLGGWLLEEKEGGTQVTYMSWGDPKGNLPSKAVNFASSAQGQVVERLKKFMDQKHGKK